MTHTPKLLCHSIEQSPWTHRSGSPLMRASECMMQLVWCAIEKKKRKKNKKKNWEHVLHYTRVNFCIFFVRRSVVKTMNWLSRVSLSKAPKLHHQKIAVDRERESALEQRFMHLLSLGELKYRRYQHGLNFFQSQCKFICRKCKRYPASDERQSTILPDFRVFTRCSCDHL